MKLTEDKKVGYFTVHSEIRPKHSKSIVKAEFSHMAHRNEQIFVCKHAES